MLQIRRHLSPDENEQLSRLQGILSTKAPTGDQEITGLPRSVWDESRVSGV